MKNLKAVVPVKIKSENKEKMHCLHVSRSMKQSRSGSSIFNYRTEVAAEHYLELVFISLEHIAY